MENVQEKNRKIQLLKGVKCDFELLKSGDWEPDGDSIDASITIIDEIIQFIEQNTICQCQQGN